MNVTRPLLFSALVVGAVFTVSVVPLAVLGSRFVSVQMDEESVYAGQIHELTKPYFVLAATLGMGAGAISLAALGWKQSLGKLRQTEEQLAILQQQLREQETMIESLRFSHVRLESAGLETFLDVPSSIANGNGH